MKKSKERAQTSLLSEKDDCYMKLKHIWQDILFYISGFFLVLYLCLVLAICKLAGIDVDDL